MKKYFLEIAVFLCGAVVMIYEIAGSRVVAPHFGASIYVWTSLIGVILASLSIGYWLGGKIADKNPSFRNLSRIILISAILIALTTLVKEHILEFLTFSFHGMIMRTLLAAIILFSPASILLGMVSPYAVRLKLTSVQTSGATVGNLYAISTVGSILGTFMAGFFLIPFAGTSNILYLIAAILVIVAVSLYFSFRNNPEMIISILLIGFIGSSIFIWNADSKIIDIDTKYNRVQIFEMDYWINGKPIQVMKVNDEYSSAMYPDNDSLVYEYLQYYRLAEHFCPHFSESLIIGGAAYSYPRYYLDHYPHATIDVVEIDAGLTKLAKEYFRLQEDPRMRIFHEDGRTFLNRQEKKYDVIFGDAYKSLLAIPFQLTTLEATQRKYDMLKDDGIVIENLISSIEGPSSEFMKAEIATYLEVFPQVFLFACHDPEDARLLQSISLVALKSDDKVTFTNSDKTLNSYLMNRVEPEIPEGTLILSDNYAPVEYFAKKSL